MLYGRLDGLREQAAHRLAEALRSHRRHPAGPLPAGRGRRPAVHRPGRAVLRGGERALLRPARLRRRREPATSAGSASSTTGRRLRAAADRLAGAGRPAVLPGHRRLPGGRTPAPAHAHPAAHGDRPRRRGARPRRRPRPEPTHEELTGEAALLAALNAEPDRPDARHRRDHPGRAGPDHPRRPGRRAGRPGRPGHRQDRGRAAPGRVPALHPPASSWPPAACCIVGPNATFLRYISQVLPSLAETGVLLRTLGDLFPGVTRPPARAGRRPRRSRAGPAMAEVLAAAVRDRQRVPDEPWRSSSSSETAACSTRRTVVEAARTRARRSGRPHNLARALFDIEIVHALAGQVAERIGRPVRRRPARRRRRPRRPACCSTRPTSPRSARELRGRPGGAGRAGPAVAGAHPAAAARRPVRRPGRLDRHRRARAHRRRAGAAAPRAGRAAGPRPTCRCSTRRPSCSARTSAPAAAARGARCAGPAIEYAEGVLEIVAGLPPDRRGGRGTSRRSSLATDLLDADRLAERHEEAERLTTAQRAAADRSWAFGHVIVDEAQELSPMAWRLLMRRCPSRSMTIVGDVAQTGDLAGTLVLAARCCEPYVARPVAAGAS